MNKLAMFSDFCGDISTLQKLQMIKNVGFEAVMLNYDDDHADMTVDDQVATCHELGLDICCAHLRYNDSNAIWYSDDWANLLIHDIASCVNNDIKLVVMHLTKGGDCPMPNARGIANMNRIVQYCQQNGVTLALENKRKSVHVEEIFKSITNNALTYCCDFGHEAIYYPHCGDVIRAFGKYYPLSIVHLHDNHGTADEHLIPYDGTIDYDKVVQCLHEVQYDGYILLEVRKDLFDYYDNVGTEEFVTKAYSVAQRINNQLNRLQNNQ